MSLWPVGSPPSGLASAEWKRHRSVHLREGFPVTGKRSRCFVKCPVGVWSWMQGFTRLRWSGLSVYKSQSQALSGVGAAALFSACQLPGFGDNCTAADMCLSRRQKLARPRPFVTSVLWVSPEGLPEDGQVTCSSS